MHFNLCKFEVRKQLTAAVADPEEGKVAPPKLMAV